jgi:polynucleotide 5'-hydroxyl-kinase GRC3/NOL9
VQLYRLDLQHAIDIADYKDMRDVVDERITNSIPLVVNTMGWSKGLGVDLNSQIYAIVQPSTMFTLEGPGAEASWTRNLAASSGCTDGLQALGVEAVVYSLEPIETGAVPKHWNPADNRALNLLSYFHANFPPTLDARNTTAITWQSTPLVAQPPYEVDWNIAFDQLVLIAPGAEDVVPGEVARVLNGAVIALVSCEPGTLNNELPADGSATSKGRNSWCYIQNAEPPSPLSSNCLGMAVVRSVSSLDPPLEETRTLRAQLLTPLPPVQLTRARVAVKGEIELPIWGMLDRNQNSVEGRGGEGIVDSDKVSVPYLRWGGSGKDGGVLGGERKRVRRNLMRRGQM